uniref:DNA replication licensing factor MCM6 n=1 Tax=Hucho hucho TaxID=62062 RepID=A0A4W5M080_9TELE
MMEATVFLGTFNAVDICCYPSPDLCLNTILSRSSMDNSLDLILCIQETQAELPCGSILRSVEVILRAEAVEKAQAGDFCDFTGTLICVPDVTALAFRDQHQSNWGREGFDADGIQGLKVVSVRDLSYRLAFLACYMAPTNPRLGGKELRQEDQTAERLKNQMTVQEMSKDKNLYHNLCTSLFPGIHGMEEKSGAFSLFHVNYDHGGHISQGDINVCIVCDPSTAERQFLNFNRSIWSCLLVLHRQSLRDQHCMLWMAAANPINGRYNHFKSLKQNVNMSAHIIFRFYLFVNLIDECNEVTNYVIARRIVDLRCRNMESVERVCATDEIQRYILFTLQFQPEAKELIHKHLCQSDSTKPAWCIIVRQLDSMLRLSEGMARLYCSDVVHPKHSVITVDSPDINFDQEQDDNGTNGHHVEEAMDIDHGAGRPEKTSTAKPALKMTFAEHRRVSNLIVLHMQKMDDSKKMKIEIESEAEIVAKKYLIEKVLQRRIHYDHIIIELTKTGLKQVGVEGEEPVEEEDPFLVVNPNYILED